jgi:hypothetical protein
VRGGKFKPAEKPHPGPPAVSEGGSPPVPPFRLRLVRLRPPAISTPTATICLA